MKIPKLLTDYLQIVLGSFLLAAGFVFFINPYKLVPGGLFGLGLVVHSLIPWISVGVFSLVLNIPILLIGIRVLGPKFGLKTVIGLVLSSLFMDGLTYLVGEDDPLGLGQDVLLCAIFGAILIGAGIGLTFRARATSGGVDVISMVIAKWSRYPVDKVLVVVDTIIVLSGLIVFRDWKTPLYSLLTIYIVGRVLEVVLMGGARNKALYIFSEKNEEIRKFIVKDLDRGGTFFEGAGMFSGEKKQVIFTILSLRETAIMKEMIHSIDPEAFVAVVNTHEILGEGFHPLSEPNGI
ncbi:MAG: YitT family protein [Spirochaetales bacterium]|nr:YitT family protein [Spirochaetales bacterium]